MKADRLQQLEAAGFIWENKGCISWDVMLAKFIELEGAIADRGTLRSWVNSQRMQKKKGKMKADRLQQLDAAGFIWVPSRKGIKMPKRARSEDAQHAQARTERDMARTQWVSTQGNDSTNVAAAATPAVGQPAAACSELGGEVEAEQPAVGVLSEVAVRGWSVEQVGRWLRGEVEAVVAPHLADLAALFAEQEIDGDALLELREESLRDALSITAFGRRNKILKAVAALHRPTAAGAPMQQLSRAHAHTSECTHTITCTWLPVPAADTNKYLVLMHVIARTCLKVTRAPFLGGWRSASGAWWRTGSSHQCQWWELS
jgi:hypothetical protein